MVRGRAEIDPKSFGIDPKGLEIDLKKTEMNLQRTEDVGYQVVMILHEHALQMR